MATSLLRQDIVDLVNQQQPGATLAPRTPYMTPDERDALAASGMTSLRRGFEAGRLGVDANAAYSDEASLRAAGRNAEADLLRQAALGSQRRAGIFAPEVGRVEDIDGASSGLSWAAGQLGQGAASMLDPMAAAAGVTALGTGLSFVPNPVAKGAGMLLRNVAAPGAAYGINVDQLKGEHYGGISADPEVMATRTPQELNQQATMYGLGAGALDTLLPAAAGRALGGAAVLAKPRMSPASKLLGGMAVEGTTELAQGEGSRYLHTQLNPLRDTSGDASARLNEFAGGAAGGAGPSLLMAGADAGFGAARRGGEVAREAIGSTVDLAKDAAGKVGEAVGKAKAKAKTVDLAESLRQASTQKGDGRLAEVNLLRGLPDDPKVADDPAAFEAWLGESGPKRVAAVQQGLTDLADVGDGRAAELLARLGQGGEAAAAALETGAEHLIEARGLQELAAEADAALDGPRKGLAGAVGGAIGRGGRRVAGAVAEGSKALWDGLLQKRNSQWTGDQYEGEKHRAMQAFDDAADISQAQRRSLSRAQLMGEILAERAKAQAPRYTAHRLEPERILGHLKGIGEDLADLAESWGLTGQREIAADKRGQQFDNLKFELGRIASTLHTGLKEDAPKAVQALRKVADPSAAPLFNYLDEELAAVSQPGGHTRVAAMQRQAADTLVAMIDPQTQLKLREQGIDLTAAGTGRELLSTVRQAVRGSERATKQLDGLLGRETANRMLEAMSMTPDQQQLETAYAENEGPSGLVRSSDDVLEDTSDYEKRAASKTYDKSSSSRVYGFFGQPRARTDLGGRDPLVGEYDKDAGVMRRPRLMALDDTEAIDKRTALLQKQLGNDQGWMVEAKSALQVMAENEGIALETALANRIDRNTPNQLPGVARDAASEGLGVNPAFINKLLSRFRDYMRQEAERNNDNPDRQSGMRKRLALAQAVLLDRMDQAEGKAPTRTTAGQRADAVERAIAYLSTHGLVVAERGTNRDPQQISTEEVLQMAERGKKLFDLKDAGSDKNNVLQFKSKLADSKKPDTPGPLYIKASDLVAFARKARQLTAGGEDRTSGTNANEQYLRDLSDGIAALVNSGLVEGMPKGFSEGSMPEGLPLKTTTYGAYMWGKRQRAEARRKSDAAQEVEGGGDARVSKSNQERVAAEQDRDVFVADTDTPARSDEDEFAGERALSRSSGADPTRMPDEVKRRLFPRMQMHRRGPELGAELRATMAAAFEDGLALAQRYLRQAKTEPQYVAPLLHALDGDNYEAVGTTPVEKAAVKALRAEAAKVLGEAKLSNADRVTLARLLAKSEGRSKVTAQNVKEFLSRVAATAGAPVPTPEMRPPTTRREQDAVSAAALEDTGRASAAPTRAPVGKVRDTRPVLVGPRDPLAAKTEQAHSTAAAEEDAAPAGKSSRPSGAGSADGFSPARKLNAQAVQMHRELGRLGFGAAHNSPVKHEGKFDWRKHLGKGEGNWVYGAGTYLSTADAVHTFYKKMFTQQIQQGRGPRAVEDARRVLDDALSEKIHHEQRIAEDGPFWVSLKTEVGSRFEAFHTREEAASAIAHHVQAIEARLAELRQRLADGVGNTEHIRKESIPYSERSLVQARKSTIEDARERLRALEQDVKDAETALAKAIAAEGLTTKSPTYQVSVDIPPDRILAWAQPLIDQPASIRLRALKAIKDLKIDGDLTWTGEDLYREIADKIKPGVPFEKSAPATSDYLQSLGILGHQYPSAKRNTAEPNYVIYDDSKITTNFVAFNKQDPGNLGPMSQAEKDKVRTEVERLLGQQVQADFKDITGYSGEWISARNVIEISTAAGPNALSVAHHEALHAFFTKFVENDPRAKEAMVALADNQDVLKRLQALLADHPNALADLKYGEERLAYMYQFWAADMLDLPGRATTLFQKIARFFRRVLGRITDQERAVAIIEAFHRGELREPSAAGQVIAKAMTEGTTAIKLARQADAALVKARSFVYAARGVLNTSESAAAREIGHMFWSNPGEEKEGSNKEGYINAKEAVANKYKNLFAEVVGDLSPRDMRDVAKILQSANYDDDIKDVLAKVAYQPHRDAVERIHKLLVRFHDYMTNERGMKIGKLNNYFPRVWNTGLLLEKEAEFTGMLLAKYDQILADGAASSNLTKEQVARRIYQKLIDNGSAEHILPKRDDGVLAPFFENAMVRELKWLQNEDAEPYLSKDLVGTMTGYFHMGARAAEYTQRFGQEGELLAAKLEKVGGELQAEAQKLVDRGELKADAKNKWVARRTAQIQKAVGAMEGTLGSDIGSTWRNINTWATVYQNVRLLPLTLFSSLVDPMGLVARGASMREAYDTFLRGMREVGTSWRDMFAKEPKQRQRDHWEKVAEYVGAIDSAMLSHHAAEEHSSIYMGKKAKRINDAFFRINGMEAWNRGMRVGATQAAVRFLERHSKLPDTHSERWLKELGVTPADLHFAPDGSLVTSKVDLRDRYLQQGLKPAEADAKAEVEIEKTHYAIRRWVQGAILTPNAAQRPAWSSDPHYSMFFHLKQFSYSFHQTLIKRAVNELDHGNLAPLAAFIWYIPVMVGSNIMRGLIQGGGDLPTHMQGMDLGDHVNKAIWQTIGATGAIAVDATHDLSSLAGPMVEQAIDALGQPVGRTVVDALPAKSLYAEALR